MEGHLLKEIAKSIAGKVTFGNATIVGKIENGK